MVVSVTDALPKFDDVFIRHFAELIRWRRDVRRFRRNPLEGGLLETILDFASLSPSVGYSQPWRFICVRDPKLRSAVRSNFIACNQAALTSYDGDKAALYAKLKLAGLDDAPEHLAVYCDMETQVGHGLGRRTM